jgi:hypothetical protein
LILTNRTTIENEALIRENPFNRGWAINWKETFGKNKLCWFLPIKPVQEWDFK